MKLELEPGSKILGTKRVSAKGQISGLSEYAGREVLVILIPETGKPLKPTPEVVFSEVYNSVQEHMKLAFKQYKQLREIFGSPSEATLAFIKRMAPKSTHTLIDELDRWLENFGAGVDELEKGKVTEKEKTDKTEPEKP